MNITFTACSCIIYSILYFYIFYVFFSSILVFPINSQNLCKMSNFESQKHFFHVLLSFLSYSLFYEFVFLTEGKGRILYTPYKLPIYIARKKLIIKVHLCTWWSSKLKFKVAPGSFIRSNIFFVIFLRAPKNSTFL